MEDTSCLTAPFESAVNCYCRRPAAYGALRLALRRRSSWRPLPWTHFPSRWQSPRSGRRLPAFLPALHTAEQGAAAGARGGGQACRRASLTSSTNTAAGDSRLAVCSAARPIGPAPTIATRLPGITAPDSTPHLRPQPFFRHHVGRGRRAAALRMPSGSQPAQPNMLLPAVGHGSSSSIDQSSVS